MKRFKQSDEGDTAKRIAWLSLGAYVYVTHVTGSYHANQTGKAPL